VNFVFAGMLSIVLSLFVYFCIVSSSNIQSDLFANDLSSAAGFVGSATDLLLVIGFLDCDNNAASGIVTGTFSVFGSFFF